MFVRSFDRASMTWSYEMHLQGLVSANDVPGLPFGSVFGSIPPHSVSKRHSHQDGEMFVVLAGAGTVVVEDEERLLHAGDAVYLPPFGVHEIRNDSDEPFDLVLIYWENVPAAVAALERLRPRDETPERTLVFCPPPTPNGGLHLGHLSGPYLRADAYARALRTVGRRAELITGTDDHQSYVAVAARRSGEDPLRLATGHGDAVLATLRAVDAAPDVAVRPLTDQGHSERIRRLLSAAAASGAARITDVPTPWCPTCAVTLYQAFAGGDCPRCGQDTNGELCEACGHPNDSGQLSGLACRLCGGTPRTHTEPALVLDLSQFVDRIRSWFSQIDAGADLVALVEELFDQGLPRYQLTRGADWGVSAQDLPGFPSGEPGSGDATALSDQIVDPWAELMLAYLATAAERGQSGDPADSVLFLGLDNTFFYAVLLPALAFATGHEGVLPTAYVTNQFLHLDGEKFSTSRNHAVWADDVIDSADPDALRLAVLRRAPEGQVSTFRRTEITEFTQDAFLRRVDDWLAGFTELAARTEGVVPGTGAWSRSHREFYRFLDVATGEADALLLPTVFSSRAYVRLLEGFIDRASVFRADEQRLRGVAHLAEEARTSYALEYLAAKGFAALAHPVLPVRTGRLWRHLGLTGSPQRERSWAFLPGGTALAFPVDRATVGLF